MPTVAVTSTRAVMEAAARRGVDVGAVLAPHGITGARLRDRHVRLPSAVVLAVWADAARACGEPELPVWAAQELGWGAYRVLDMLAASAATVGQAFEMVSRYFALVHDTIRLPLVASGEGAAMGITAPRGEIPAPYVDYTLAACVFRVSVAAGRPLHPAVWRRRAEPADRRAHEQVFGPQLHFGADADRLVFDGALWHAPMPGGDPMLYGVLKRHAEAELASRRDGLAEAELDPLRGVRDVLTSSLPRGRAEVAHVARRLGVSKRTLQRRLTAAGTTWTELLDGTRRALAAELLQDPELTVDEIALLLGYAEASAFHRAVRRWTGRSPGDWRRALLDRT